MPMLLQIVVVVILTGLGLAKPPLSQAQPAAKPAQAAGVEIAWNFENGSLGSWSSGKNGEIILTHSRNAGGLWYYFRLDQVQGKTLTFVFENARRDFYDDISLPVCSYDQRHWFPLLDRTIQPHASDTNLIRYTFRHTFGPKRAWLAFSPPYTNAMLNQQITAIETHPHANVLSICDTPLEQQTLPLVHITDPEVQNPKKTVFLLCREDAYETATSWLAEGFITALLADSPLASAIRRRCHVLVVPIFDRDGVSRGEIIHPLPFGDRAVFWTETWPETTYSFFEQRQMKQFLQQWKKEGNGIDLALSLHSETWKSNFIRPEHCKEENATAQENFFIELLGKKYMPWNSIGKRLEMDTRFTKVVHDFFPSSISGVMQTDYIYTGFHPTVPFVYKSTEDLAQEGDLLLRAIGEFIGIQDSNPAPYLLGAMLQKPTATEDEMIPVQCVYRDLLGRAPTAVQVVVNDTAYDLAPVDEADTAYAKGVLYAGFLPAPNAQNTYYFQATNEAASVRVPREAIPGPIVFAKKKK
ncbi:MAG: M14-type cytosolic carboxypeptidase [bacterium]|jgi:hypothetical protein|nr:M14-type cytosolic carboxypeptidase [bacterium]